MKDSAVLLERLRSRLGDAFVSSEGSGLDAGVWVRQAGLRRLLELLKSEEGMNVLVDFTAVDFNAFGKGTRNPNPAPEGRRFKLVYRLMNLDAVSGLPQARLAVFCWHEEEPGLLSVRDLWPNADWLEREVWDMFGVRLTDRPDIKRLLLYEEFQGHPLRKDYPINKRQPLIGPKDERPRERLLEGDLRPRLA